MEICEENSKKRSRESSPVVLRSWTPLVQIYEKEFKEVEGKLGLNVHFINPLITFVANGMIKDINDLMRTHDPYKKSWDTDWVPEISYEDLVGWDRLSESQAAEVKDYLESAARSQFFDCPLPKDRPDCIRGFILIYPEKQNQDDPMFHEPHLENYFSLPKLAKFTEKLAKAAVAYHKCMTGLDVMFSKLEKANMYSVAGSQYYFITLEATDLSGKAITCKSRVRCAFYRDNNWSALEKRDDNPMVVDEVLVESFCCVE